MDRALDDIVNDRRDRGGPRGPRNSRPYGPRDGVRKSNNRDDSRNIDRDWVHDRFEDEHDSRRDSRGPRNRRIDQYSPEPDRADPIGARLRVDNLHYDLTEDDLKELFERIGRVMTVSILYDRSDRSQGIAFVTYHSLSDARTAVREFDGANAYGQPIRLTLMQPPPTAPTRPARNPFDTAVKPSRSLFERIEEPAGRRQHRSASPGAPRHSDVSKPPPSNIDRYVPVQSRRRSPPPRRGSGRGDFGRRPGARREDDTGRRESSRLMVQGRPKKTAEELDAEMEDYWGSNKGGAALQSGTNGASAQRDGFTGGAAEGPVGTTTTLDDDIDMIE